MATRSIHFESTSNILGKQNPPVYDEKHKNLLCLLVCQTKRTEGRGFQLPYLFIYKSKKRTNQTSDISHNERRRNAALPALLIAMASAQFSIQFICMSWSRMRGSFLITTLFCNNCSTNWLKRPNPFKLWWVSWIYGFCGNVTSRGNGACGESIMWYIYRDWS